jgi:hypothetical protein
MGSWQKKKKKKKKKKKPSLALTSDSLLAYLIPSLFVPFMAFAQCAFLCVVINNLCLPREGA